MFRASKDQILGSALIYGALLEIGNFGEARRIVASSHKWHRRYELRVASKMRAEPQSE